MKQKPLIIMFLALLLGMMTSLSGLTTWTVPGSYATIRAAVSVLNGLGPLADSYSIDVAAGHTENITTPILLFATGTSSFPITIRKSGAGANPVVTRTDAGSISTSVLGGQGDAVFIIQGTDYLTIDGINVSANNQGIEYGYYFRKANDTNGDKFDTIKNCVISMFKNSSPYVIGIYGSNNDPDSTPFFPTGITVTSTDGRNESLAFYGNTVQNVHAGIVLRGYNHPSSPYDFFDQNMMIGQSGAGNIIQNYGGGSANASFGVYLLYQTSPNVSYNTIDNAAGGGSNASSTLYGIYDYNSSVGGAMVFDNNAITLNQGSIQIANCIHVATSGTSVSVSNNVLNYGTFVSSVASHMIYCNNATNNMTITGNYNSLPINKIGQGALYPYFDGSLSPTGGTATITYNNFSNITLPVSSQFYGLQHTTSSSQVYDIHHNTISNITGGGSTIYGIYVNSGALGSSVHDNTITNITNGGVIYGLNLGNMYSLGMNVFHNTINNLTTTGASEVAGIYTNGGGAGYIMNIYQHELHNIFANNAGGSAWGIYIANGSGTTNVFDNMIYDLRALGSTATTTSPSIGSIRVSGGQMNNVHNNTTYLNHEGAPNAFFSAASLYITSGMTNEIRNNIFVNKSAPGASGIAAGIWKSNAGTLRLGINSNKNIYFTGAPNATHPIGYIESVAYPTLDDYKAFVADRDQGSYSEDVPFISSTSPYDLHIVPGTPTRVESNSTVIAGCSFDFDGDTRNASTPDIGADEGNFIAVVDAPGVPACVSPANAGTGIAINATLVWAANSEGGAPTGYKVYTGIVSGSLTLVDDLSVTTYTPANDFWYETQYYWRVDAYNAKGTTTGTEWSFTTGEELGSQTSYTYIDSEVDQNMTYYYWLQSFDLSGTSSFYGPLMVKVNGTPEDPGTPMIPLVTELLNAYPNPFNPSATIRFALKDAGAVRMDVFNARGQMIRSFADSYSSPGIYKFIWDGKDANGSQVGSGVYMYRMTCGNYVSVKKMVMSK